MNRVRAKVARRVAELDAGRLFQQGPPSLRDDLEHFIDVMEYVTSSSNNALYVHTLPRVMPAMADAIVRTSHLLGRLDAAMPEIVTGPLRPDAQYWTRDARSDSLLDEKLLVGILDAREIRPSTKPFYVGLFTSTAVLDTYGMWRVLLESYGGDSSRRDPPGPALYDRPWHTWHVAPRPDVVVREIASAADWVDFVTSHPLRHHEMIYPDWRAVARNCDAIHMTLRALAAVQGMCFLTDQGVTAPTFWDVESAFWLRWCFSSVRLVETIT